MLCSDLSVGRTEISNVKFLNRRIRAASRLEKTFRITRSNHQPDLPLGTQRKSNPQAEESSLAGARPWKRTLGALFPQEGKSHSCINLCWVWPLFKPLAALEEHVRFQHTTEMRNLTFLMPFSSSSQLGGFPLVLLPRPCLLH